MLAGAMLLGCGTAALAAGGGITFGAMGVKTLSGKTVVEPGETVVNATGCEIPAAPSARSHTLGISMRGSSST